DVDDLSWLRHVRDARELDPLDMSDDGDAGHRRELCPTNDIWQTMVRSGLLRVRPRNAAVLRRLLPLLLLPGVFMVTWLVDHEREDQQRAESRTLAAQLAHAEERVRPRTGAYTDDVDRLVDEAHAHALARKHGIDAFAGPDVFEVTVYAKRYGGRDFSTVSSRQRA